MVGGFRNVTPCSITLPKIVDDLVFMSYKWKNGIEVISMMIM